VSDIFRTQSQGFAMFKHKPIELNTSSSSWVTGASLIIGIALRFLFLGLVGGFAAPGLTAMPQTSAEQELEFVPLAPPPPYSYQENSVRKTLKEGRRRITFVGTTAMPPYFEYVKNTLTYERAAWQKQLLLSKGRWVYRYSIDCDEKTFDRDGDRVGWRDVYFDPTAYEMWSIYCPLAKWQMLLDDKKPLP
jgi:hypothetical protein